MNIKIKPCPFCGSENLTLNKKRYWTTIMCKDCCAEGGSSSDEDGALIKWNTRLGGDQQ